MRPEIALLLPDLAPSSALSSPVAARERLFEAVHELLAEMTQGPAPLLVMLDDVQWLDEASAALLHYLARRLEGN
mgnify:CR=1 FL=1